MPSAVEMGSNPALYTKNLTLASLELVIEERMKFARQNPLQNYKVPHRLKFSGKLLDNSYDSACAKALKDPFFMCDKVHGTGSAASAKAQLDWSCAYKAKAGILQNKTVWADAAKMPPEAWYESSTMRFM